MKVQIVDDDFISRSVMLAILSTRARCDVTVSSDEAVPAFEDSRNMTGRERSGILMASSIDDPKEIMGAFRDQCDAYLIKPLKNEAIMDACSRIGKPLPAA